MRIVFNASLSTNTYRKISRIKENSLLDKAGFVGVGGRLRHADVPFETKHPILLAQTHRITNLLIELIHKQHFHTLFHLLRPSIVPDPLRSLDHPGCFIKTRSLFSR